MSPLDLALSVTAIAGIALVTRSDDVALRRRGVARELRLVAAACGLIAIVGILVLSLSLPLGALGLLIWLPWPVLGVRLIERTRYTSRGFRLARQIRNLEGDYAHALTLDHAARASYEEIKAMGDLNPDDPQALERFHTRRTDYLRLGAEEADARTHMLVVLADMEPLREPATDRLISLLQEIYGRYARLGEPRKELGDQLNKELEEVVASFWSLRSQEVS